MNTKEIKIFNEEEINEWIRNTGSEWSFDGKWIRKTYKTHSWKSTLMVVNAIGHLAELAWHHPDLVVSYAFVEVKLMNHAKKGITQLDFDLAKKIDEFISSITIDGFPSNLPPHIELDCFFPFAIFLLTIKSFLY